MLLVLVVLKSDVSSHSASLLAAANATNSYCISKLGVNYIDRPCGCLEIADDKGNRADHHHLKGKGKVHDIQNRLGSIEVDLVRSIKAKQVDDHKDDDLDSLDLINRIKKLEKDFVRLLKVKKAKKAKKAKEAKKAREANKAKEAREVELKAREAKKAKEADLKAKKAKKAMLAELKAKKAKEAMLAEVVQISSDEDDDEDPTAPASIRSRASTAFTSIRSKALIAYTSIISKAPIASTSNAQGASTTPKGYKKIAMTGCVLALFALNAPTAPPSFLPTRKRKSTLISVF
nr:hypothetical protein [Tanacetum cinerariifolium]